MPIPLPRLRCAAISEHILWSTDKVVLNAEPSAQEGVDTGRSRRHAPSRLTSSQRFFNVMVQSDWLTGAGAAGPNQVQRTLSITTLTHSVGHHTSVIAIQSPAHYLINKQCHPPSRISTQ